MKNTKCCPKCSSKNIVRVPDNQNRHASGNNIYTSTFTLMKKMGNERGFLSQNSKVTDRNIRVSVIT